MADTKTPRPVFLSGSADEDEILYTLTVDAPGGAPLMGLIASDVDVRLITWPDGEQAVEMDRLAYPEPAVHRHMPKTFTMLDLSTSHLTEKVAQELNSYPGVIADNRTYGWFLWVPEDIDGHIDEYADEGSEHRAEGSFPAEIVGIWRYAAKHTCQYVLLDQDAEVNPDLPSYDW